MRVLRRGLVVLAVLTVLVGSPVVARAAGQTAQQLFESGQYDPAIQAINEARGRGAAGLPDAFLAAHVLIRQNQNDRAKEEFAKLVASADPIWRQVGESSAALVDNNLDGALNLATQAVNEVNERTAAGAPPDPTRDFHALYQLGLAKSRRDDWTGAFEAFERAAALNPGFAYAHYYAGLAASRIQRPDRMAVHFEQFLQMAPNAPERAAVMSIMRTVRGA
jgi:tetratricopeptide (TPR) repeat protein